MSLDVTQVMGAMLRCGGRWGWAVMDGEVGNFGGMAVGAVLGVAVGLLVVVWVAIWGKWALGCEAGWLDSAGVAVCLCCALRLFGVVLGAGGCAARWTLDGGRGGFLARRGGDPSYSFGAGENSCIALADCSGLSACPDITPASDREKKKGRCPSKRPHAVR